jgi:hypothetical protein
MLVRIRAIRTVPFYVRRRVMHAALSSAAAALLAAQGPAFAQDADADGGKNGVALKVGALGLGVEYTRSMSDRLTLRGALYGSQYGFDSEESDIEYALDLIWDSFSLGVDFHPGKGPFRLSAGYLSNDNRLEAVSTPTEAEFIGDSPYTPAQIGTLSGLITFENDGAPFAGLGWDWSRDNSKFGMSFDLGIVSQGSPVVELRSTGTIANDPGFQTDLEAEEEQIEDDLDGLDMVPYLTLGFVFRF